MSYDASPDPAAAHHVAPMPIRTVEGETTDVDRYWAEHTVQSTPFATAWDSFKQLEWRFAEYPLFREFSRLWGDHDGEVVLDYGCGPGNDLVGFGVRSRARRIIGVDVSRKALELARDRLGLHGVDPARIELVHKPDSTSAMPLEDASVDYLQAHGVLQHASDPDALLAEFHRVLRPGGRACLMVYNADSVWRHLYVAYEQIVVAGAFQGLGLDAAFARSTDGPACPISRSWQHPDFISLCASAGLRAEYVGGYLSGHELERLDVSWSQAISDVRLPEAHRRFLRGLRFDRAGLPMVEEYHAGIGGTYWLTRSDGAAAPRTGLLRRSRGTQGQADPRRRSAAG